MSITRLDDVESCFCLTFIFTLFTLLGQKENCNIFGTSSVTTLRCPII